MPQGYPSIATTAVTDKLATIAPSVGNVSGYYVWLKDAYGNQYGPSAVTDASGNWTITGPVPQGTYTTHYQSPNAAGLPLAPTNDGVKPYLVSVASNPVTLAKIWVGKDNGLVAGAADNTAAFNALLQTVYDAGGGTIRLTEMYTCLGQIAIPNTGASPPSQPPIRITGTVADKTGTTATRPNYNANLGGLDLRYAGRVDTGCGTTAGSKVVTDASAVAADVGRFILNANLPDRSQIKTVTPGVGYTLSYNALGTGAAQSFTVVGGRITSTGAGDLEIDHCQLVSGGITAAPFGYSDYTVVNLHDNMILGNTTKVGATCDEDIWVFGTAAPNFIAPNWGFQGYGTNVDRNQFDHVRRLLLLCDTSSLWVQRNAWWQQCGSNLTGQTTLTAQITVAGGPYTTLSVAALTKKMWSGSLVRIGRGATVQQVTLSADAAIGATTLNVNSFTPNQTYAIGVIVTDLTNGLSGLVESYSDPATQVNFESLAFNRFEMNGNYTHASRSDWTNNSFFVFNEYQDSNPGNLALHRFEANAGTSTIIPGGNATGQLALDQVASPSDCAVISVNTLYPSQFPAGVIANTFQIPAGNTAMLFRDSAGVERMQLLGGANPSLQLDGPLSLVGNSIGAGSTGITIGNNSVVASASLTFKPPSGQTGQIQWMSAGVNSWLLYDAAGANLFLRDSVNARMLLTFTPGATVAASGMEVNATLKLDGGPNFNFAATAAGSGAAPTLPANTPTGATGGALKYVACQIQGVAAWLLVAQ